jgi:hypothetical protein
LMEEEMKRRQQGAFDSHAQPGLVVCRAHLCFVLIKTIMSTSSCNKYILYLNGL